MDKNRFKKECMGIVNQLFDLAEVPIEKRQAINDKADEYMQEQFLRLFAVSGRSEKLPNYAKKGYYCGVCGSTDFFNDEEE